MSSSKPYSNYKHESENISPSEKKKLEKIQKRYTYTQKSKKSEIFEKEEKKKKNQKNPKIKKNQKRETIYTSNISTNYKSNKNLRKNINLFSFLKLDEFSLINFEERKIMIDDLFEYDKVFYLSNYGIQIHEKKNIKNRSKKNIFNFLTKKKREKKSFSSKLEKKILELISQKKIKNLKNILLTEITKNGIPTNLRPLIWKNLLPNKLKINKKLFKHLFKKAIETYKNNSLIKKDIDRTFYHFTNCKNFPEILIEATILLQMFSIYRPDIEYIQGMSYLMVFLLFLYKPYNAFKNFTNLILTNKFLYKNFIFDKNYIKNVQSCLEHIISKNYNKLYFFLKEKKLDLWSIFWIEWMFAIFLRSFDLKTCFIFWDFILLKGNLFIFKLTFVIFGIIDKFFDGIRKDFLIEDIRKLLLENTDMILENVMNSNHHEFDFIYIEKLLKKANL